MPVEPAAPNPDDLRCLYDSGMSVQQVADHVGRSQGWVRWRLERSGGLRHRSAANRLRWAATRHNIEMRSVIRRHEAGESVLAIARDLGLSRSVLAARFAEAGYDPRGRSEAARVRLRDTGERHRVTRAAHLASGSGNAEVADALRERGVPADREWFVEGYAVDVYADPLLIEVTRVSASPVSPRSRERRRLVNLLDAGHVVAYVWAPLPTNRERLTCQFDAGAVADALVAWHKLIRAQPPTEGQYRVFRGCGETVGSGSVDDARRSAPTAHHRH